jgi:hypothetical protein
MNELTRLAARFQALSDPSRLSSAPFHRWGRPTASACVQYLDQSQPRVAAPARPGGRRGRRGAAQRPIHPLHAGRRRGGTDTGPGGVVRHPGGTRPAAGSDPGCRAGDPRVGAVGPSSAVGPGSRPCPRPRCAASVRTFRSAGAAADGDYLLWGGASSVNVRSVRPVGSAGSPPQARQFWIHVPSMPADSPLVRIGRAAILGRSYYFHNQSNSLTLWYPPLYSTQERSLTAG